MSSTINTVDQRTKLAGNNSYELLTFTVAGQQFGINVFKVREIIEEQAVNESPGSHENVMGITFIRGESIAVIDTRSAIKMGKSTKINPESKNKRKMIVTEYNQSTQALLVDDVSIIHHLKWDKTNEPPTAVGKNSYLTAVAEIDQKLVGILDVEKILSEIHQDDDQAEHMIEDATVGNSNRIIVVDDSDVARRQVMRCITKLGFEVDCFENGQKALDKLHELVSQNIRPSEHYALMISDIEMPFMDGYTLTAEVKGNADMRDLVVVMHSSLRGVFNEALTSRVGADHFLAKYEAKALQELVTDIAGKGQAEAA